MMLTDEQIQTLVDKYVTETLEQDIVDRAINAQGLVQTSVTDGTTPALASAETTNSLISDYQEALSGGDYAPVEGILEELLEGLDIDKTSARYKVLCYYMSLAQIQVLKEARNRSLGNIPNSPKAISGALFGSALITPHEIQAKGHAKTTYGEAVERYIRKYLADARDNATSNEQIQDVLRFLNDVFLEIAGADTDIATETEDDIISLRDAIRGLPRRNIQKYRAMPIKELLGLDIPQSSTIARSTVNKLFKWMRAFYSYCKAQNIIQLDLAAAIPTISRATSPQDERLPLTSDEILKLLNLLSANKPLNNAVKALATSGLRLSELYKCSIGELDGVIIYDLRNTTSRLKTLTSYRVVPVHSSVDMGLLEAKPNKEYVEKAVNKVIREHISADGRKVLYSLRHSFATELKTRGVEPLMITELMGHSRGSMTFSRYAGNYPVKTLKEAIETLDFI
nr:tyrosine-type recombinase/integrase [uncultured Campylobacter sp.]